MFGEQLEVGLHSSADWIRVWTTWWRCQGSSVGSQPATTLHFQETCRRLQKYSKQTNCQWQGWGSDRHTKQRSYQGQEWHPHWLHCRAFPSAIWARVVTLITTEIGWRFLDCTPAWAPYSVACTHCPPPLEQHSVWIRCVVSGVAIALISSLYTSCTWWDLNRLPYGISSLVSHPARSFRWYP